MLSNLTAPGPGSKIPMSVNLTAALNQPVDTIANCENRKASASNRAGGSLHLAGRALSQFPLPLQARAGGVTIIRAKAKAAADKVPTAIFIEFLHTS